MANATIWIEYAIKTKAPVKNHWDFFALCELVEECNHIIVISIMWYTFSILKPKILVIFARIEALSVVNVSYAFCRRNDNTFAVVRDRILEIEVFDGPNRLNQMYDIEYNDGYAIPKGKLDWYPQEKGEEDRQPHSANCDERSCGLHQIVPAESHEKFLLKNVYCIIISPIM